MKKVSRKKVIEILNNKSNCTYDDLAHLTGYHPKSLIRINSMIKKGHYTLNRNSKIELYENIIYDYLKSDFKTYKEFYNSSLYRYSFAYTTLCKILKTGEIKKEIVFIKKIKNKGNCYFEVVDSSSKSILFTYNSIKNDIRSVNNILYLLIKDYGAPNNISFVNVFDTIPISIQKLLDKYTINLLVFKSIYRKYFLNLSSSSNNIKYKRMEIKKEDFYNSIIRKTISDNVIQFNNIRYTINTPFLIKKNTKIILYYDNSKTDIFIKYINEVYELTISKKIVSKRGITKYF